jgi:hypothetical protein
MKAQNQPSPQPPTTTVDPLAVQLRLQQAERRSREASQSGDFAEFLEAMQEVRVARAKSALSDLQQLRDRLRRELNAIEQVLRLAGEGEP